MEFGKLKNLFLDASVLPASEREAFLDSQCPGDPLLRERVQRLLDAHEQADEYLADPTVGAAAVHALSREGPGSSIGAYKVLEMIGEGGFGVVYLAEQGEPVRRRVALKVIKPGMDSRQVVGRFEQERQALALMDHPNIAKVLDAGATGSGLPYFVMELVRGEPITAYADAQNLSIAQRLELFQQVCHAVQHAHQKGIIHRDLKPSNILVAQVDGRATPRIIDFGIAKAAGGAGVQLTDKTVFTEFRQFIGTPEYMSPEQTGMDAADIDTRSDIYALGVLLYALLTGGPPFDSTRLRSATWEEMRRIIREDEPERPSTRLHSRQHSGDVAARRETEPSRLIGLVRGDLDWIVMKCLEKDRARRYETANALALDVARHLEGEPVTAAPPSRTYRARKFLRKHRGQVIAGSLVALSLLAAVVGTTTFAVLERRRAHETDRVAKFQARMLSDIKVPRMGQRLRMAILADAQEGWRRQQAAHEAVDTETINSQTKQLQSLLADTNLTNTAINDLDQNVLERIPTAIDEEFSDQPRVKAQLLQVFADTCLHLGLLGKASDAQEQALDIRTRTMKMDDPERLTALAGMARIRFEQQRWLDADPLAREALAGRRRALGEDDPATVESTYLLARIIPRSLSLDPKGEAEALLRDLYDRQRNTLGDNDARTLETMFRMGYAIFQRQEEHLYEDELIETSTEGLSRLLPENHETLLLARGVLGFVRGYQGRLEECLEILNDVVRILRDELGDDNWLPWYYELFRGRWLHLQGRSALAESTLDDVVKAARRTLNGDAFHLALALTDLAAVSADRGDLQKAELAAREAIAVIGRLKQFTTRSQELLLLRILDQTGDPAKVAEAGERRREMIRSLVLNDSHAFKTLSDLSWNMYLSGHASEGEPLARQAVDGFRALGTRERSMVDALGVLATIVRQTHGAGDALQVFEELRRIRRETPRWIDLSNITFWALHAECLTSLSRFADAESELNECCRVLAAARWPAPPIQIMKTYITVYDAWAAAEPGRGHEARADEWRQRLPSFAIDTDPPISGDWR